MAYDESLAERLRALLVDQLDVVEKKMMGGLTFMVNGKMCVGIIKGDLMCRVAPEIHASLTERPECSTMAFTGRPMKGFVIVDGAALHNPLLLQEYVNYALDFNPRAKASR